MALPPLRLDLEFMPSPVEDKPGLLIRDPYHFSDMTLIVPTGLIECLELFDGEHTDLDLRELLVSRTGRFDVSEIQQNLVGALSNAGFLRDEVFQGMRDVRVQEFRDATHRVPLHAGTAYPGDAENLQAMMTQCMNQDAVNGRYAKPLLGIAAPHVSVEGGWQCYQAAYRAFDDAYRDRTFVILGTSHYGEPEKFGLTRKNFTTPFGETVCDTALLDRLTAAGGSAVLTEDYCHAVEHSIEFQVLFLQHVFGPGVRILPILCGPYARSIYQGGKPEDDENVRRFLDALGEINAREDGRLAWVLGVDLAHMGRRYGDEFAAEAGQGTMEDVARRDKERLDAISAGDADSFWRMVQERRDDLKWCGSSSLYTFMKAVPQARAEVLRYGQWNIDEGSVVSFAGLAFYSGTPAIQ